MLYTTHLGRLDDIPTYAIKLIIMRYPPEINILKYENLHFEQSLSPSEKIFNPYNQSKHTIDDWHTFSKSFNEEIETREDMQTSIKKIVKLINMGIDIYIICTEYNGTFCHRTLLAQYIENKYNIKSQEF
jgi:uncharacterized protein YeaO (DUF488 family)